MAPPLKTLKKHKYNTSIIVESLSVCGVVFKEIGGGPAWDNF